MTPGVRSIELPAGLRGVGGPPGRRSPAEVGFVRRPRLEAVLDRAADRELVVIRGPAGAGKSVLIADWTRPMGRRARIVPVGDHALSFWGRAWLTLAPAPPGQARSSAPPPTSAIPHQLAALFAARDDRTFLVIEDAHRLDRESLEVLEHLLHVLPPQLRIVLAARLRPDMRSFPRRLLDGSAVEIGPETLHMDAREVTALFALHGISLAGEELDRVMARCGGWPIAARLSLAARLDGQALEHAVDGARACDGALIAYLRSEVLADCSPRQQRFVMEISVLEQLNGAVCDALTGSRDGAAQLAELADRTPLLVPLGGGWYRPHPMCADALRADLTRQDPVLVGHLHRRASQWFSQAGRAELAIRHGIEATDTRAVARILRSTPEVRRFFEGLVLIGQDPPAIDRWLARLPEPEAVPPDLRLAIAWTLLALARVDLAANWADDLDDDPSHGDRANRDVLRAVVYRLTGRLTDAVASARRGLAASPPTAPSHIPALAALGPDLYWTHQTTEAREILEAVVPRLVPGRAAHALLTDLGHLALIELDAGRPEAAATYADRALCAARGLAMEGHFVMGETHLAQARLAQLRDDVPTAAAELATAEQRARIVGEPALLVAVLVERSRLDRALGRSDAAAVAEREACIVAATSPDPVALGRVLDRSWEHQTTSAPTDVVAHPLIEPLTERENGVLRLLRVGLTQPDIGRALSISTNTAKTHTKAIYRKLGVHNRDEAVRVAIAHGLLRSRGGAGDSLRAAYERQRWDWTPESRPRTGAADRG